MNEIKLKSFKLREKLKNFPRLSDALESETEKKRWEALQAIEDMIIKKYKINQDDFKIIETVILKTEPHKAGKQWKFTGAFYYGKESRDLIVQ